MEVFDVVVVIPVGPACKIGYLSDTINSIAHYITDKYKIVIADDSQKGLGKAMQAHFDGVDVIASPKNLGKVGGLYRNLSAAYQHALQHYNFPVLLKMDDDALAIGSNPQRQAIRFFADQPATGMAGRHITGQVSADHYGNLHDNYWPRKQLLKDACSWKLIRRPAANLRLRKLFFRALRHGYEVGENIQGGVYFMSRPCLEQLNDAGLLPDLRLSKANLGEDLLFSLLVKAVGLNLADLSSPSGPVGCAWKGLPASPQTLYRDGKKLIHSIRFWKDSDEAAIRQFFKEKRGEAVPQP